MNSKYHPGEIFFFILFDEIPSLRNFSAKLFKQFFESATELFSFHW